MTTTGQVLQIPTANAVKHEQPAVGDVTLAVGTNACAIVPPVTGGDGISRARGKFRLEGFSSIDEAIAGLRGHAPITPPKN